MLSVSDDRKCDYAEDVCDLREAKALIDPIVDHLQDICITGILRGTPKGAQTCGGGWYSKLKNAHPKSASFIKIVTLLIIALATGTLFTALCISIGYSRGNEYIIRIIKTISESIHQFDRISLPLVIFSAATLIVFIILIYISDIYKFLTGEELSKIDNKYDDPVHDDITAKVYRRLILRTAVLREAEKFAMLHCVHNKQNEKYKYDIDNPKRYWKQTISGMSFLFNVFRKKESISNHHPENIPPTANNEIRANDFHPQVRAYNLAVTDLFVEKALTYLNRKARIYSRQGFLLITLSFFSIAIAGCVALANMNSTDLFQDFKTHEYLATHMIIVGFTKSFTFYGLIILFAVYAGRMGKALFDQAERMKDRRHALRQGRLFVHLNGGKLTIDELDKAFNWNTSQDNAFYHFNPEAQAPWGNMFKEMMITMRETAKSSMELAKSVKKDG